MGSNSIRTASAKEFAEAVPFLRISADRIECARLAMVERVGGAAIAKQFNKSRPAVSGDVSAVWEVIVLMRGQKAAAVGSPASSTLVPPGWEQVTIVAPSWMVQQISASLAALSGGPVKSNSSVKGKKK